MKPKLTIREWLIVIWYAIKGFFRKIRMRFFPKIYYMTEKGQCLLNYYNKLIENNCQLEESEHIQAYDDILADFQSSMGQAFDIEIGFEESVGLMKEYLDQYKGGVLHK